MALSIVASVATVYIHLHVLIHDCLALLRLSINTNSRRPASLPQFTSTSPGSSTVQERQSVYTSQQKKLSSSTILATTENKMNNQGAIQCKVKLVADGEQQEMRRFQLDDSSFASNFDFFKEKLRAVFPELRGNSFKVTWTDSEGDSITIGNDEELLMAMMSMYDMKVLEVHVNSAAKEESDEEVFANMTGSQFPSLITCDVCNNQITRYRYKCLQCHDYDLCLACEQAGNHSQHVMVRLADLGIPRGFPKMLGHWSRTARKAAHHAAKEAHRCAKSAARAAHQAARDNTMSRCPFRRGPSGTEKASASSYTSQTIPLLDTSVLYDMASSFLTPFMQGPDQGATTPNQAPQTQANQGATATGTPAASGAGTGNATPTVNPIPLTPTAAPVDVLGNILRDVFSAINANVAQAASGASTPVPMQTPNGTPVLTPVATPAATPVPTPVVTNATPVVTNATPVVINTTPMDVEQTAQARQTAPIYPNVPQGPDAGWTFVSTPPMAPVVPQAQPAPEAQRFAPTVQQSAAPAVAPTAPLNPDEVKYASQLGQLRRMGFADNIDLLGLLKRFNGNIGMVVNHLFEHGN